MPDTNLSHEPAKRPADVHLNLGSGEDVPELADLLKDAEPFICSRPHLTTFQWFTRSLAFLGRLRIYTHALGLSVGLRWYLARIGSRIPVPSRRQVSVWIHPPQLRHSVKVRMFPSSDEVVFDNIFVHGEYEPLRAVRDPKLIVDLGANVGYASALFASWHPEARVLAVEPDPENFSLCCQNLTNYGPGVKVLLGAVWSERAHLVLARGGFGDGRSWSTQVAVASSEANAEVEAWDVCSLLEMLQAPRIDLLKIDIEGSEAELFRKNTDLWLDKVSNLCVELHGTRRAEIFFNALRNFKYDLRESGEYTLCLNLRRA